MGGDDDDKKARRAARKAKAAAAAAAAEEPTATAADADAGAGEDAAAAAEAGDTGAPDAAAAAANDDDDHDDEDAAAAAAAEDAVKALEDAAAAAPTRTKAAEEEDDGAAAASSAASAAATGGGKAEASDDEEDEDGAALSAFDVSPADLEKLGQRFPQDVLAAFADLGTFGRSVNAATDDPEVVIIGRDCHGKSVVAEAILGHRVRDAAPHTNTAPGEEGEDAHKEAIKAAEETEASDAVASRGVSFKLVYVPDADALAPSVVVKGDAATPADTPCAVEDLPGELARRATALAALKDGAPTGPLQVRVESSAVPNMTVIDAPTLLPASDAGSGAREAAVVELAKPAHRLVVAVGASAATWDGVEIVKVAKKADMQLGRTLFALTGLFDVLQRLGSVRDLNQLLARAPRSRGCVFLTVPSARCVQRCRGAGHTTTADDFGTRLAQAWARDKEVLVSDLRADMRRNEKYFGVAQLREAVLQHVWKGFKDSIPELRKHLAAAKTACAEAERRAARAQADGFDEQPLRAMTSNFVASWLGVVADVTEGSTSGTGAGGGGDAAATAGMGESTYDEAEELGEWTDRYKRRINLRARDIPNASSKMYGGAQFERLLRAFRAAASASPDATITDQDLERALQGRRPTIHLNGTPDDPIPANAALAAAAETIEQTARHLYTPLVNHLCARAAHILTRSGTVAFAIIEGRRKGGAAAAASDGGAGSGELAGGLDFNADLQDMRGYSYFASTLREIFEGLVEKVTERCRLACLDEVIGASVMQIADLEAAVGHAEESGTLSTEETLAVCSAAFADVSDRLAEAIALTAHSEFTVSFVRDMSGEVLQEVTALDAKALESMFELDSVRDQLAQHAARLGERLERLGEQEGELRKLTAKFSRFVVIT